MYHVEFECRKLSKKHIFKVWNMRTTFCGQVPQNGQNGLFVEYGDKISSSFQGTPWELYFTFYADEMVRPNLVATLVCNWCFGVYFPTYNLKKMLR